MERLADENLDRAHTRFICSDDPDEVAEAIGALRRARASRSSSCTRPGPTRRASSSSSRPTCCRSWADAAQRRAHGPDRRVQRDLDVAHPVALEHGRDRVQRRLALGRREAADPADRGDVGEDAARVGRVGRAHLGRAPSGRRPGAPRPRRGPGRPCTRVLRAGGRDDALQVGAPRRRLVVLHPVVPEQREAAARPDHARELGDGARRVEPVEGVRADDRVERRVRAAGAPRRRRRAPRRPGSSCRRRSRRPSSGSTATTSRPAASSARVSLPVPAPTSAMRAPGASPRRSATAATTCGRVAGPAELVLLRHVGEAGDERMEAHGAKPRAAALPGSPVPTTLAVGKAAHGAVNPTVSRRGRGPRRRRGRSRRACSGR